MQLIRQWRQLLPTARSCTQRLLSTERQRNRKWVLPSLAPDKCSEAALISRPIQEAQIPLKLQSQLLSAKKTEVRQRQSSVRYPPAVSAIKTRHLEPWARRKIAIKGKYPAGWRPPRRISPEAIEGIRVLRKQVRLKQYFTHNDAEAEF